MIAVSHPVTAELADFVSQTIADAIIAPGYEAGTVATLSAKKSARSSSCKQIPTHPYPDVAAGSSSARRIGSASSTARFGDHAIELFDDAGWRTPWTRQQTGLTLGSDGFIPFRDNVDFAAEGGVTTIVEPGGSLRTPQVEAGCQELGIRHIATGLRLFHH